MTNISRLDTSINTEKKIDDGETAMILGGASFFQKSQLNLLKIGSEINRVTDETKQQFEKKHFLDIQKSKYDMVIEKLIQSVYYQSTMYTTNIYEGVDSEYMNALLKQKLDWYKEKLLLILREDFLKYEYSIYKFDDHCVREFKKYG